jgi:hypothetical protein
MYACVGMYILWVHRVMCVHASGVCMCMCWGGSVEAAWLCVCMCVFYVDVSTPSPHPHTHFFCIHHYSFLVAIVLLLIVCIEHQLHNGWDECERRLLTRLAMRKLKLLLSVDVWLGACACACCLLSVITHRLASRFFSVCTRVYVYVCVYMCVRLCLQSYSNEVAAASWCWLSAPGGFFPS